ncbi:MAG: STAS domain-containing protein [Desulfatibacillaceae bacterium]
MQYIGDRGTTLRLSGVVSIGDAEQLKEHLLELLARGTNAVIELEEVRELSLAAFQLLLAARLEAARAGLSLDLDWDAVALSEVVRGAGL